MKRTLAYRGGLIAVSLLLSTELICPFSLQGTAHDAVAQSKVSVFSWNNLLSLFKRKKFRQGVRSSSFCPIAPVPVEEDMLLPKHKDMAKVWNTKPLFIWNGSAPTIRVEKQVTDEVVWEKILTPKKPSVKFC